MKRIGLLSLALAVAVEGSSADAVKYRLEAHHAVGDAVPHRLQKILVVAISDDREIRNRFEDKFVSHLRGREMAAISSHGLVPSLTEIGDRDRVLAAIDREGVDAVMTVRAVGLDEVGEKEWAEAWEGWVAESPTVRDLIERTLPVPQKKAKRYGIEFALWEIKPARLLWASRTGPCARKDLKEGVADLLQLAIEGLKDARWL